MPVIAMTREMGTKGGEIAHGLAQRMDIPIIDHNFVEQDKVSKEMLGESGDVFRQLEGKRSLLERWQFQEEGLANMTAGELFELAENDNVIIRGWVSTYLLSSIDHVLCVRVCAPLEKRVNTLTERLKPKDRTFARHEIIINDTAHGQLMKRMMHDDWQNYEHYDLIINTGRMSTAESIDLIENTMQLSIFQKTPQSEAQLRKLRIESQRRTGLSSGNTLKTGPSFTKFGPDPKTYNVIPDSSGRKRAVS